MATVPVFFQLSGAELETKAEIQRRFLEVRKVGPPPEEDTKRNSFPQIFKY